METPGTSSNSGGRFGSSSTPSNNASSVMVTTAAEEHPASTASKRSRLLVPWTSSAETPMARVAKRSALLLSHERTGYHTKLAEQRAELDRERTALARKLSDATVERDSVKRENALVEAERDALREELRDAQKLLADERWQWKKERDQLDKEMRGKDMTLSQERQRSEQEMFEMEERLHRLHEQELGRMGDLQAAKRLLSEHQDIVEDERDVEADMRQLEHELSQTERALNRANSETAAVRAELAELHASGAIGANSQLQRGSTKCQRDISSRMLVSQREEETTSQLIQAQADVQLLTQQVELANSKLEAVYAAEEERDALRTERIAWMNTLQTVLDDFERLPSEYQPTGSPFKHLARKGQQRAQSKDCSPGDVLQLLHKIQSDLVFEARASSTLRQQLQTLKRQADAHKRTSDEHHAECKLIAAKCEQLSTEVERLKGSKALFVRQQQSMMDMLQTVSCSAADSATGMVTQSSASQDDSAQLMVMIKQTVEAISNDNVEHAAANARGTEALAQKVVQLEREKAVLESKLEANESHQMVSEHHEMAGLFDPVTTKVLHFKANPERQAIRQARRTAKKNKEFVKAAGSTTSAPVDTSSSCSAAPAVASAASAAAAVDPQKSYQRLKKLFRLKTKTYREAVYLLTGFKVDMTTDNTNKSVVRLRSIYAEREDDELLFQWAQSTGELNLMESDFGQRVDPNVFAYLSNFNSFPAFLAALTMDLFEKQTMQ